jgi:DNA-binding transcriptional regulator YhcF (GntR family)
MGVSVTREPGTHIRSLRDLAKALGVGIVTVQQVAQVLEHEGFLVVRRGHDGGYYGARPDEAALSLRLDRPTAVAGRLPILDSRAPGVQIG